LAEIVLIGTVHRDPNGHDKLFSICQKENPDYVTLEMSPFAVQFRRERRLALKAKVYSILNDLAREIPAAPYPDPSSHPAVGCIFTAIDFPYEYRVASLFSRSRHVPFQCIASRN
jgi:hypothetical protein